MTICRIFGKNKLKYFFISRHNHDESGSDSGGYYANLPSSIFFLCHLSEQKKLKTDGEL